MIRAIFFDFDDTLTHTLRIVEGLFEILFDQLHLEWKSDYMPIMIPKKVSEISQYIKTTYTINQTKEEIESMFMTLLEDQYRYNIPERQGAKRFLQFCHERGWKIIIYTSSPIINVELASNRLGFISYIDSIYSAEQLHSSKGNPEFLLNALREYNLKTEDILFFEDSQYSLDVAKQLGIQVIGVQGEYNDLKEEYMISNFDECFELEEIRKLLEMD